MGKLNYYTGLIPLNKNQITKIQTQINKAIRLCMGYVKSTPIRAIMAETAITPFETYKKIQDSKYLVKAINKGNIKIQELEKTLIEKNLKDIKTKDIGKNKYMYERIVNIEINDNIKGYEHTKKTSNKITLNQLAKEALKNFNTNKHFIIFTDASKKKEEAGIGIYFENLNTIYRENISQELSIKNFEIYAVFIYSNPKKHINK